MSSTPGSLSPGTRLGHYVVRKTLGVGGMGAVYEVAHAKTGGIYALKALPMASNEDLLDRFLREGEAQARVDGHPNIVRVHSLTTEGAHLCLVMDVAPGGDLKARLAQEGPLPDAEAVEIALQLASGLAHAHANGVLHRDLKPANVLFDSSGSAQLVDFGLAFISGAETLTQTGAIMGSPGFMAPEQATAAQRVDETADVYGLGAVLYAMLCGRPPFNEATVLATLNALVSNAPVSPSTYRPGLDPALEAICLRSLAKRPEKRYASASALADALRAYRSGEAGAQGRHVALGTLLVAACVLLLLLVARAGSKSNQTPQQQNAKPPPIETPAPEPTAPGWYLRTAERARPHLPLPDGIRFGAKKSEYVSAADDSVLVWVPPGGFVMGSNGSKREQPVRRARMFEGYFIGKYEVTWKQFRAFCEATGRDPQPPLFPITDTHPVHAVTWFGAEAYCEWAGLRLPDGREWEFAARGTDGRLLPWDKDSDLISIAQPGQGFASKCNSAGDTDGFVKTCPVDQFKSGASPNGCLGMAGNVSEWVAATGSRAPGVLTAEGRIVRGGNWRRNLSGCRASHRSPRGASQALPTVGFRVSRSHPRPPLEAPEWFHGPSHRPRPTLPLPAGIVFGTVPGEYLSQSDGSVLVWIPAGQFTMGSNDTYREAESPSRPQEVRPGLFIGKYEVSWAQFLSYLDETGLPKPAGTHQTTHPVADIYWNEAAEYCAWAGLRLPDEAEWEFAARGPHDARDFTWTNEIRSSAVGTTPTEVDPEFESHCNAAGEADGYATTSPVDAFPLGESFFGCFAMNGNVCEFVDGPWALYYVPGATRTHEDHVVRGGSFAVPGPRARLTRRKPMPALVRNTMVGFRVARSP